MIIIADKIKNIYPEALLGILVMKNVCNPNQHEGLNRCKFELENSLRKKFVNLNRADLKGMEPKVASLVEAIFMAELKNFLLTAGHNLKVFLHLQDIQNYVRVIAPESEVELLKSY